MFFAKLITLFFQKNRLAISLIVLVFVVLALLVWLRYDSQLKQISVPKPVPFR